jgi:DNA invertase Pin-like site-specific DNA recombinase
MKKAFGYVRVSGKEQVEGHGWERQEDEVRAFCLRMGIELVKIYYESHTGAETDRPIFMELMEDCLALDIRIIVVERLDRLARDNLVQCTLLKRLLENDIVMFSADTGENITESYSGDPMRKALISIQGIFAELDKNMIVRKLRKAREAKRTKGLRCEGRKPYGEHPDYPEEAGILDRIVALAETEKLRPTDIATLLNTEGVYTRKGSEWNPGTVYKILRRLNKVPGVA